MQDDFSAERNDVSAASFSAYDAARSLDHGHELPPTIARGTLTPPRLQAAVPNVTHHSSRATIADLRFPSTLVQDRAEEIAGRARSGGAPHSLRLWRIGYEQALLALAREACRISDAAPCESLFWEQNGEEFLISVTFGAPCRGASH